MGARHRGHLYFGGLEQREQVAAVEGRGAFRCFLRGGAEPLVDGGEEAVGVWLEVLGGDGGDSLRMLDEDDKESDGPGSDICKVCSGYWKMSFRCHSLLVHSAKEFMAFSALLKPLIFETNEYQLGLSQCLLKD